MNGSKKMQKTLRGGVEKTFKRQMKKLEREYDDEEENLEGVSRMFDEERARRLQILYDLRDAMESLDSEHYIEVYQDDHNMPGSEVWSRISRRKHNYFNQFENYIDEAIKRQDPYFIWEDLTEDIEHGSDVMPHQIARSLKTVTGFTIKKYQKKTGAYWPYMFYKEKNVSQLFTEENWNELQTQLYPKTHCLINCIPELEQHFKEQDYTACYQTKFLDTLAIKANIKVNLETYNLDEKKAEFSTIRKKQLGSKSNNVNEYTVTLFQNHYFINKKIESIEKMPTKEVQRFQYRVIDWMKYFYLKGFVYTRNLELRKIQCKYQDLFKVDLEATSKTTTQKDIESFLKKKENFKIEKLIACDTETFPHTIEDKQQHFPYAIGWVEGDLEGNYTYQYSHHNNPLDLMTQVKSKLIYPNLHKNAVIYFHNLKFDMAVTIDLWNIPGYTLIPTQVDGIIYELSFYKYNGDKQSHTPALRVRDSYKLIPQALKNWGKCLKLDTHKLDYEPQLIRSYRDYLKNKQELDQYLKYDCLTLYKGLLKFRELALNIPNIKNPQDPLKYLTISAFAQGLTLVEGCLEGVCQYSGMPQEYIMKAMMGGRVQCRNNEKQVANDPKEKIIALDVNSLYPAAMVNMGGLPMGNYKLSSTIPDKYDMYIGTFKIISLKPKAFGVIKLEIDNKNHWITETTLPESYINKEIIIDNITHEDLIKYNEAELELIGCIYWDNGKNEKLPSLIKHLYDARLTLKKEGNPVQEVIKLVLNSIYGKFIQRPNRSKLRIDFGGESKLHNSDDIVKRTHFRPIKGYRGEYFVSEYEDPGSSSKHYNSAHCGIQVLSYSKQIMNEQMFTFENDHQNTQILYTDTDSMYVKVPKEFEEKNLAIYHNTQLGQFSNDFDGADHGVKAAFIAPKMYGLCLDNGNAKMKCKGVTKKALEEVCKNQYDNDVFKMYDSEERIEFDISAVKFCPKFETRGFGGCMENKLVRNVKFNNPKRKDPINNPYNKCTAAN